MRGYDARMSTPAISFKNVSFFYNNDVVLDDITFNIEEGDYVGILGPNGSGKTTLLKLLFGLLEPRTGSVSLFGKNGSSRAARARIGYVPQTVTQSDWSFPATVEEIVSSGCVASSGLFHRMSAEHKKSVDAALELVEIADLRKRLIGQLSGGQRQRVFIARALAGSPDVLVLDEPTVGVDIAAQETFYAFLKKLNTEQKMTIVFVSHDIDVIAHEAASVLCLNKQLVCHVPAKDAITSGVLEKMYGEKGKYILHGH